MGLERSTFRWRPQYRTSMDGGHLVPVWARMGLPGDTFRGSRATVVRAQPLLNPVMHNAEICEYTFGVAVRTLFDNEKDWDDFITGGKDGQDDKVLPYQLSPKGGWKSFSLYDYFGHRINVPNIYTNTLKARAYYKVYNDWIRNTEFQDEIEYGTNFGLDTATGTTLVRLNHIRDYFRGAMPDTQRGPEVVIPILS